MFPGIQAGDFVAFVDHRGRYRVDYVTTDKGNHLTIGPTRGYGTLAEAKRAAAEESFRRGHNYGVLFTLVGSEPSQLGHIVEGRFFSGEGGSGRDRGKSHGRKVHSGWFLSDGYQTYAYQGLMRQPARGIPRGAYAFASESSAKLELSMLKRQGYFPLWTPGAKAVRLTWR